MENCQAINAATLVVQLSDGKEEKLYWPVRASEVMKTNPGHYVALLISTTFILPVRIVILAPINVPTPQPQTMPTPTASPRLISSAPLILLLLAMSAGSSPPKVMQGMWAKKYAKMRTSQSEQAVNQPETVPIEKI